MIKNLRVTVDGKAYEVTIEMFDDAIEPATLPAMAPPTPIISAPVPLPAAVAVPAPSVGAPVTGPGDIRSPLAGRVVAIEAKPGQTVSEGQQVITLEAMKMNTYIYAPKAGQVSKVCVNPGDAVEEGAMLMAIA